MGVDEVEALAPQEPADLRHRAGIVPPAAGEGEELDLDPGAAQRRDLVAHEDASGRAGRSRGVMLVTTRTRTPGAA